MKEFIDKLISRLEESEERYDDVSFAQLNEFGHTLDYEYAKGKRDGVAESKQIVTELAEEYNKKQEHEVWLNGCDDDTIFTMEMTNNEYEFLKRVSELANETSTYGCMPRLYLDEGVGYTAPYTEGE